MISLVQENGLVELNEPTSIIRAEIQIFDDLPGSDIPSGIDSIGFIVQAV